MRDSVLGRCWCCLTFDMSGGPKGAKRPSERPLDEGLGACARKCIGDFRALDRNVFVKLE